MLKNNKNNLNRTRFMVIPNHLSIIMDGNGRWAKKRNLPRFAGHKAGVKTVKMVIAESIKVGIGILTLYAFSTENWKRPKQEISSLMNLFQEMIEKGKMSLLENNIRVRFIGHRDNLPMPLKLAMENIEEKTKKNKKFLLNIAINYGGRSELCHAFKLISEDILQRKIDPSQINQNLINEHLFTSRLPDPDLLIRTGGELRISNFLLWQIAYTELWFTKTFWPDFSKKQLWKALSDYEKRVRKFGEKV
ncbi:MAG: isoprenyl transferase [Atribacterota bacterium]|jgi:undecaprenyl diphosphate synthase|nr:isoprenyl transferase [Atribacterota bacterium]MDD4896036.1 isoprenyl transferase [Atribacterota bacterium]MDD5636301.1 isoprenyl transferase [Atribacterota bacterium]